MSSKIIVIIAALCLGVLAVADEPQEGESQALTLEQLRSFADSLALIRDRYVDEISEQELLEAALDGMVSILDSHSGVLQPNESQKLSSNNRGTMGSTGIDAEINQQRLRVAGVTPGSPADKAAVRRGDLILSIDGKPVRGRSLKQALSDLSGPPGSSVELVIKRANRPRKSVQLERVEQAVSSVIAALLDNDIGYFRVTHFHINSADDFQQALAEITGLAELESLAGIIIDLRDNAGGVVAGATGIADGFLDEGLVVYTEGRYANTRLEYIAQPGQWQAGTPLVLLVNGQSASASEILAGALQAHGRARVIGQQTFGKGTVQSLIRLRDGRGLKLTTARYFTPDGLSIDQQGITPDQVIEEDSNDKADRELNAAVIWLKSNT